MKISMFDINFNMWTSIGETLINSLWIGLIFWFLNWLILQVIQKNMPEIRYWITTSSVVLFFAVICQLLLFSYRNSLPTTEPRFYNFEISSYLESVVYEMVTFQDSSTPPAFLFSWVWFTGLIFMSVRFLMATIYTYWIGYKALPVSEPFMIDRLMHLKNLLEISEDVTLKFSDKVSVIFTYGFFKPVIIWPVALINRLNEDEATMILSHELMHIGRKDYIIKVVLSLINTVLYYHPFVWWANRIIDTEREYACDLGAIQLCSTQAQYAKTLVKLQELKLNLLATTANGFSDNNFNNRIKRIFNMPVQNNFSKAKLTILLLLLTTAGLFAYEYHKNQIETQNLEINTTDGFKPGIYNTHDKFEIMRDTSPLKSMSKSTQVITRVEGDNTTTIKMEDGKVVDVEVNGEKIDESEFDKYVKKDENTSVLRKRRGIDREEFEFNTEDFMKNMPFMHLEEDFNEGDNSRFGFLFKDMEDFDSLFTKQFKNFNFSFDNYNLDSLTGGKMKIFGFDDNMKGFHFDIDSFVKGFKFEFEDMDDNSIIMRKRPEMKQNKGEREKTFEFMKPEKMMLTQVLEKQLKKDGLLKTGKVNKVELNHKQLKINGEKMPEVIFEKYKSIYENETGLSLVKGNNVVFEIDHKEKNSKEYKSF